MTSGHLVSSSSGWGARSTGPKVEILFPVKWAGAGCYFLGVGGTAKDWRPKSWRQGVQWKGATFTSQTAPYSALCPLGGSGEGEAWGRAGP